MNVRVARRRKEPVLKRLNVIISFAINDFSEDCSACVYIKNSQYDCNENYYVCRVFLFLNI